MCVSNPGGPQAPLRLTPVNAIIAHLLWILNKPHIPQTELLTSPASFKENTRPTEPPHTCSTCNPSLLGTWQPHSSSGLSQKFGVNYKCLCFPGSLLPIFQQNLPVLRARHPEGTTSQHLHSCSSGLSCWQCPPPPAPPPIPLLLPLGLLQALLSPLVSL